MDADGAWQQLDLARQFQASGRNAVFVVPEAPATAEEAVSWPNLNALLNTVGARSGLAWPPGPLVFMGLSGAHITVVPWLKNSRVGQVILLDAIYGESTVEPLRAWLRTGRGRLVLVDSADTAEDAERLIQGLPGVVRRTAIPDRGAGFSISERRARVDYFRLQSGHLEMVTDGRTIPPLLSLTSLSTVSVWRAELAAFTRR